MKTVFCVGVFDMLHKGHVLLLERARALGGMLIVAIVKDPAVTNAKGQGRPIISAFDRAYIVSRLSCVDEVYLIDDFDPTPLLRLLTEVQGKRIDTIVIGEDQKHIDFSWAKNNNIDTVKLKRTSGVSTSDIVKKLGDKDASH